MDLKKSETIFVKQKKKKKNNGPQSYYNVGAVGCSFYSIRYFVEFHYPTRARFDLFLRLTFLFFSALLAFTASVSMFFY